MEKNFGLSPKDFEEMVTDLKKNQNCLFKRVFLKHFNDCMTFLQTQNNTNYNDAYDATMDALVQFRRLIVEGKLQYGNLKYLFTKMATQIHYRNLKKFRSKEIQESHAGFSNGIPGNTTNDSTALKVIWAQLGEDCQELLKLHYYGNLRLTEIAELKEKTDAAVRKQKERCPEKTRIILQKNKMYHER